MKKIVALLLALCIISTLLLAVFAEEPSDAPTEPAVTSDVRPSTEPIVPGYDVDPDAWYAEFVKLAIAGGFMSWDADGAFRAEDILTRGELVFGLWQLAGAPVTEPVPENVYYAPDMSTTVPASPASPPALNRDASVQSISVRPTADPANSVSSYCRFTDMMTTDRLYQAAVWAVDKGVLAIYKTDYSFRPDEGLTREELISALWRFAKAMGADVSVGEDTNILSYNDAFDIAENAIPAFQWACGAGLVGGTGEGYLSPKADAERCQLAAIYARAAELLTAGKAA